MKTAEEWEMKCGSSQMITPQIIKQIQLDAIKEGMRRAAKVARPKEMMLSMETQTNFDVERNILTAAEQLTTKDL